MFGNAEIQFRIGKSTLELNIGHHYRFLDMVA
jgi:hypothetical protein